MSSEVGVGRGLAPYEELRGFAGMATPELDQFGDAQAAAWRRITPRRNRWADVQAFDARVVELEAAGRVDGHCERAGGEAREGAGR